MIEVDLTREEYATAVVYAVLQDRLRGHLRDRTGYRPRGYAQRIESTAAEFAVAKWLKLPIEIRFTVGKGDVGPLEVRWAQEEHYGLIVRPDDPDEPPYLLVTGRGGLYRLRGWAYGREAKRDEWLCSPNGRPPLHIVPQDRLRPTETLASPDQPEPERLSRISGLAGARPARPSAHNHRGP